MAKAFYKSNAFDYGAYKKTVPRCFSVPTVLTTLRGERLGRGERSRSAANFLTLKISGSFLYI